MTADPFRERYKKMIEAEIGVICPQRTRQDPPFEVSLAVQPPHGYGSEDKVGTGSLRQRPPPTFPSYVLVFPTPLCSSEK